MRILTSVAALVFPAEVAVAQDDNEEDSDWSTAVRRLSLLQTSGPAG